MRVFHEEGSDALRVHNGKRAIFSRHQEPFYDFPFGDMSFHDFCDIGFFPHPIPYAFGIYHDAWSVLALVEAAGLVSPHDSL